MSMYQNELAQKADISAVAAINRRNIEQALADYARHIGHCEIIDSISDTFIDQLGYDSAVAKSGLRAILRRVKGWNEQLQAVVINGTRTHNPDWYKVLCLAKRICRSWLDAAETYAEMDKRRCVLEWLASNACDTDSAGFRLLNEFAPKAYRKGRKLSRVFNDFAKAIGVYDGAAGSKYQRLFAELADEINSKKIDFKLYLSINPAHFLTASNPYYDTRGEMMVSCHSLNSEMVHGGYYSAGTVGYARDSVTMVAFTAANPDNPETLNNRKTSRQLFMYSGAVGRGRALLQSRMYHTSNTGNGSSYGGCDTVHPDAPLYRDLVQRVISEGEGYLNLWSTANYDNNQQAIFAHKHKDFGGYADWQLYDGENIKISVQKEALEKHDCPDFTVGAPGLCVCCGEEISGSTHYCESCDPESTETCYECGCRIAQEDCCWVYNSDGEYVAVCPDCSCDYYTFCDACNERHHNDNVTRLANGDYVCNDCLESTCFQCGDCGEWFWNGEHRFTGYRDGELVNLCWDCFENNYRCCEHCRDDYHENEVYEVEGENGETVYYCDYCYHEYYCKERDAE